ncbi:hypothetical protein FB565_007762 [Actinoplanes lutulentus]|uniref:Secreted protein n=1 Tax=Actinoplanes lutulentus TaxID=1287878 RepID=A0A327ZHQ1_9ACTN|nr:hypothetical protein [Actinoplanes lutulentus]MBB2947991.1 hypothetical protein [Actinoplanes lutulentus]RAK40128.1 hypothetical protein B0I29_103154 [Actinoplanes lutulentus]
MATTHRSVLLRSLPVLLALVLAFFTAPASAVRRPSANSISASSTAVQTASADACDAPARTQEDPASAPVRLCSTTAFERVLRAQTVAGAAGSRAPPASLA